MLRSVWTAIILFSVAFAVSAHAQTVGGNKPAPPQQRESPSPDAKKDTVELRVERYLRNVYAWGPSFEVKVGPTKQSQIPDLIEVPVKISMGGQSDDAVVYVSKTGNFIMRGELADMSVDPLADIRSKLNPGDSPSIGPKDAKVTLIEFADFECPSCRQMDLILRDYLASHPETRLVFKNFPLTEIHPWAMTAAIAGQCSYEQNPATFWKIHDAIFDAQEVISPSNVWDKMIDLASGLKLDMTAFKSCLSNPEISKKIETSLEEGRTLNVTATPTTFVNARRVVGPDKPLLDQFAEYNRF